MNRLLLNVALFAAFVVVTIHAPGQNPPPAQAPKANADPYANNADAGKLRFPLAAPAGRDSGAIKTALPGAANVGTFDMDTWKYGSNYKAPEASKIWNPVRLKMMQGGKVTGGTVFSATDPETYCAMANAGYDLSDGNATQLPRLVGRGSHVARLSPRQGRSGRSRRLRR